MKLVGMLLMLAGWVVIISAIVLLSRPVARDIFIVSGLGVEILGLALAFRKETL